jgi:hypothetical protein
MSRIAQSFMRQQGAAIAHRDQHRWFGRATLLR